MAEIIFSSEKNIVHLKKGKIPGQIHAVRALEWAMSYISNLQRRFIQAGPDDIAVINEIHREGSELAKQYSEVLEKCRISLEELSKGSESEREYYAPLLSFLYHAKDPHNPMPFIRPLKGLKNIYIPGEDRLAEKNYVELRISESLSLCECYAQLLSKTMGSPISKINLGGEIQRAFNISRYNAIRYLLVKNTNSRHFKDLYGDQHSEEIGLVGKIMQDPVKWEKINERNSEYGQRGLWESIAETFPEFEAEVAEENRQITANINRTSKMDLRFSSEAYSFRSMLFFYLCNTLSNHFKAAHIQHFMDENYDFSSFPEVSVSIKPYGNHHVAITSEDTGVGIPSDLLKTIFTSDPEDIKTYDGTKGMMSGSKLTLPLYSLVLDSLCGDLYVQSDGPGTGSRWTLIIPKDLENPKDPPPLERFYT